MLFVTIVRPRVTDVTPIKGQKQDCHKTKVSEIKFLHYQILSIFSDYGAE